MNTMQELNMLWITYIEIVFAEFNRGIDKLCMHVKINSSKLMLKAL